ncbi:MAG TPA: sugar transferase [Candidatus Acidoferrum sp.]|nr:sugar transferase [Candidatus Acidoferrum sp.]
MKTFNNTNGTGMPAWKRVLDICLILLALPVLVPVALIVAVIIHLVSEGPILFKQERMGQGGRKFQCFKFRTMRAGADSILHEGHLRQLIHSDAPMTKMDARGDARIIPGGVFLRATGLDELPQLINVLRGEMSIVGPRPCLLYEAEHYLPWQRERFNVAPGLTGWWQVNGKNKTTFAEMIRLDIEYSRRLSLGMDLGIIIKTVPVLLTQVMDTSKSKKPAPKTMAVERETIFPAHAPNH